jgi:hypothetical protein
VTIECAVAGTTTIRGIAEEINGTSVTHTKSITC